MKRSTRLLVILFTILFSCNLLIVNAYVVQTGEKKAQTQPSNDPQQLLTAAQRGDEALVQRLIEAGLKVNYADNNGVTALMMAAQGGNAKVINLLIDAEARINARDNRGSTPLLFAAQF